MAHVNAEQPRSLEGQETRFDFSAPRGLERQQLRQLQLTLETYTRRAGSVLSATLRTRVQMELVSLQASATCTAFADRGRGAELAAAVRDAAAGRARDGLHCRFPSRWRWSTCVSAGPAISQGLPRPRAHRDRARHLHPRRRPAARSTCRSRSPASSPAGSATSCTSPASTSSTSAQSGDRCLVVSLTMTDRRSRRGPPVRADAALHRWSAVSSTPWSACRAPTDEGPREGPAPIAERLLDVHGRGQHPVSCRPA